MPRMPPEEVGEVLLHRDRIAACWQWAPVICQQLSLRGHQSANSPKLTSLVPVTLLAAGLHMLCVRVRLLRCMICKIYC